jgi:hypothetical protein
MVLTDILVVVLRMVYAALRAWVHRAKNHIAAISLVIKYAYKPSDRLTTLLSPPRNLLHYETKNRYVSL